MFFVCKILYLAIDRILLTITHIPRAHVTKSSKGLKKDIGLNFFLNLNYFSYKRTLINIYSQLVLVEI